MAMGRCREWVLIALLAALAGLAVPAAALGYGAVLDSSPLDVEVDERGRIEVRDGGAYYGLSNGGFSLYLADGPLAGRSFATMHYGHATFTPVHQLPTARDGDVLRQRTVLVVREAGQDHLRVTQTTHVRDGAHDVRVTWEVQNLGAAPQRLRATVFGAIGGSGGGIHKTSGSRRFVGTADQSSGKVIEQVRESRLAGEAAPVPVPAWTGYFVGYYDTQPGEAAVTTTVRYVSDASRIPWRASTPPSAAGAVSRRSGGSPPIALDDAYCASSSGAEER